MKKKLIRLDTGMPSLGGWHWLALAFPGRLPLRGRSSPLLPATAPAPVPGPARNRDGTPTG
ncbi:hypothetical protein EZJ19_12320 [Parasulfuritortus cantonensis]|uniref:Uncharacterized protein n=1 Tax=Parasulfuritortus cantonensis TaxID=2528202 RepID=A0A4R1B8H8_9PROT|nr:hypothetical protein [Parasulfuritortus cantonensis]TCJ12319.1 hypothetical protein EZJ19_12320 [Parasulfuritortus cantonensis]